LVAFADIYGAGFLHYFIGYPTAEKDADRGGEERPGGEETDVQPGDGARWPDKWEPCQEENQRGVTGKLTQAGADDLPAAQQTFGITPVKGMFSLIDVVFSAPIYSSSSLFAVRDSCGS
jgi:hypothetical protein